MSFLQISNKILLEKIAELIKNERKITLEILRHFREIERRMLFAELGYSSLFEYAVKELKYSEGAAHRRISAMRLLQSIPEIETKIQRGDLTLSQVSQAHVFIKREKIVNDEIKKELVFSLEGKSTREVERELVAKSKEPAKYVIEKLRPINGNFTELRLLVDEKFLNKLEEIKNLLGHSQANIRETIEATMEKALVVLRPKLPKVSDQVSLAQKTPAPGNRCVKKPAENSRYIPREVERNVWARDNGQCTFQLNGRRCSCKHALEYDHIVPFSVGGKATTDNLRLRCQAHNQLAAIQVFGARKMEKYMPRLR